MTQLLKVKEPWEMTQKEYADHIRESASQIRATPATSTGWGKLQPLKKAAIERLVIMSPDVHYHWVKLALSEGKPVPQDVLADYPELKKQAEDNARAYANKRVSEDLAWQATHPYVYQKEPTVNKTLTVEKPLSIEWDSMNEMARGGLVELMGLQHKYIAGLIKKKWSDIEPWMQAEISSSVSGHSKGNLKMAHDPTMKDAEARAKREGIGIAEASVKNASDEIEKHG